jgi:SAM-dependent methyltransferase
MALKADRFIAASLEHLAPLRGTRIYDQVVRDLHAKTEQEDSGYARWLAALLPWLVGQCQLERPPRVLDFGCGSGELAVLTHSLGYETWGVDVHAGHLRLAHILAAENGMPEERLVLSDGASLPFSDGAFDIVTMDSVLEHLSDAVLGHVLLEIRRVCTGLVFVLVPNRLKTRDDHTGLALVPALPRRLAVLYIRARGPWFRYGISKDGSWDVHYRTLRAIQRRFARHGFETRFVPDDLVYPPLALVPAPFDPRQGVGGWKKPLFGVVRGMTHALVAAGMPIQAFHPYLNLVMMRSPIPVPGSIDRSAANP